MPVLIEQTVDNPNSAANTYSLVADADAYFLDRLKDTSWSGATEENRQFALINSYDHLNYAFYYIGNKYDTNQGSAFPRVGLSQYTELAVIPEEVKKAQFEFALIALTQELDPNFDYSTITSQGVISSESTNIGRSAVVESVSYTGAKDSTELLMSNRTYKTAEKYLSEFLASNSSVSR